MPKDGRSFGRRTPAGQEQLVLSWGFECSPGARGPPCWGCHVLLRLLLCPFWRLDCALGALWLPDLHLETSMCLPRAFSGQPWEGFFADMRRRRKTSVLALYVTVGMSPSLVPNLAPGCSPMAMNTGCCTSQALRWVQWARLSARKGHQSPRRTWAGSQEGIVQWQLCFLGPGLSSSATGRQGCVKIGNACV